MISQEGTRAGMSRAASRREPRVRKALLWIRNAVLVTVGVAMTFPVSAVLVYHVPYWRLPVENRDGSSAEEAVIVHAENEAEGIEIEYVYAWYHTNPFTQELASQELVFENGKTYDVLRFQNSRGEVETFWFDISEWYGVW